jgi:hypothetical protein
VITIQAHLAALEQGGIAEVKKTRLAIRDAIAEYGKMIYNNSFG